MNSRLLRPISLLGLLFGLTTTLLARDEGPAVAYYPQTENVEGDQPLYHTYELEITSPSNLPAGSNVVIDPVLFVIRKPDGVSDEQALSHVTIESLVFTGPTQKQYATVVCDFPVGTVAGEYAFGIRTPGWGVTANDTFGFINAKVFPPRPRGLPTVTLNTPLDGSVFTWYAGGAPVAVPVQFSATAPEASPLTSVDADISGTAVTLTDVSGLGTTAAEAGGVFYLAQPGLFTVTARATNDVGTAIDTAEFTVQVVAPPPTVTIEQPAAGSSFTITEGGTLSVPFAFSGASVYGNLSQLTATINDVPVAFTPSGLGTLNASGLANLQINAGGTYVLSVSATNPYGTAAATGSFTVTVVEPTPPPPTVTITSPANGTVINRVAGSPATAVPYTFTAITTAPWTISSVGASLSGSTLSVVTSGLGTATAGGSGTLYVSTPGTYSLVATGTSGGSHAADTVSFTVVETTPPPPTPACGVNWLPSVQLGKVVKGGSTVDIKFELDCNEEWSEDRNCDGDPDFYPGQRTKSKDRIDYSVVIAIYEIFSNGSSSTPQLFPYNPGPNAPGYTIQGNDMYHLNFVTAKGARRYQVEIYHNPTGNAPVLLDSRQIRTK
jgi:hypothetical protein